MMELYSVTTDDPDNALLSGISMRGISWENGLRLAGTFLNGMQAGTDTGPAATTEEYQP